MNIRGRLNRLEKNIPARPDPDDWSRTEWPAMWPTLCAIYGGPEDDPARPPPMTWSKLMATLDEVYSVVI